MSTNDTPIKLSQLFASPANFMAIGGGAGMSPVAPGTVGTVVAIPVLFLMPSAPGLYLGITLALFVIGVWCCEICSRNLGVHDHGGIVWDEIVGYLITMIAVPRSLFLVVLGFVLFRFFDILKPWPIRWVDNHVHGGLGIMLDDVIAGVFAAVALQLLLQFVL